MNKSIAARATFVVFSLLSLALCGAVQAQAYPVKPVRWMVPSAAGGAFDVITRSLAPVVSEQMGHSLGPVSLSAKPQQMGN